jgi:hypothetical protein
MRRFNQDDRVNASVAGGLSALALLFDDKKRRIFLALVFFSRCLVSLIQIFQQIGMILLLFIISLMSQLAN